MRKLIKTILKEEVGKRSWTSELDRMQWTIQDFERYIRDLYPFWWMNEVNGKIMLNRLGEMSQETRDRVYAAMDKIHFYWDAAMDDFDRKNLYYRVDWGDGYDPPGSKQAQNRKKIMIYTKKANPYVGKIMSIINDPDAIQLVR